MDLNFERAMSAFLDKGGFVNIYSFVDDLGATDVLIERDLENLEITSFFIEALHDELDWDLEQDYLKVNTLEELQDKLNEFMENFDESYYEDKVRESGVLEPAYEYYIVDDRFAYWLSCVGENVIEVGNQSVWCRGGTGQWIGMDSCMKKMLKEHYNHVFLKEDPHHMYLEDYYASKEEEEEKQETVLLSSLEGDIEHFEPFVKYLFIEHLYEDDEDKEGSQLFASIYKQAIKYVVRHNQRKGMALSETFQAIEDIKDNLDEFLDLFTNQFDAFEEQCRDMTSSERYEYLSDTLHYETKKVISEETDDFMKCVQDMNGVIAGYLSNVTVVMSEDALKEFEESCRGSQYFTAPWGKSWVAGKVSL